MQIKLNQFSRRQHIFVFLTASGLSVVQFQRRFTGWICLNRASLALAEASQDFSEILVKLRDATADWKIPAATWVSWIMPGDILAVVQYCKPKDQVADFSNLFPFERNDIQISEFSESSDKPQSIYWIHKDWVTEVAKVSAELGWVCDEIYARAQLLKCVLPKGVGKFRLLLEGDNAEKHLHIYASNGSIVRTTQVGATGPEEVAKTIRREMGALAAQTLGGFQLFVHNLPAQATGVSPDEMPVQPLPALDSESLTARLICSAQTGIEVRPTFGALVSRINAYSLGFATVGSLLLALMVWHDGVLQTEIESSRRQVRTDTARYQTAKHARMEAVKMAEAVQVKASMVAAPPVFQPLSEIMSVLSPPSSLSLYESDSTGVRIAGLNGKPDALKSLLQQNPRFSGVRLSNAPDFLKTSAGAFALEMQWNETVAVPKPDEKQKVAK